MSEKKGMGQLAGAILLTLVVLFNILIVLNTSVSEGCGGPATFIFGGIALFVYLSNRNHKNG